MDYREKIDRLRAYLRLVTPAEDIDRIISDRDHLERMGAAGTGEDVVGAREGLTKLERGQDPLPHETRAIEAIILPRERPVVNILEGRYVTPPQPWTHLSDDKIRQLLETAIASIGRVELPDHPTLPYGGTGFVVGANLIMTNRHVAELFSSGLGIRELRFSPGRSAQLDFAREHESDRSILINVRAVAMIHPFWDMALLQVENLPTEQGPLRLSIEHPDDIRGREVVIVGYPAYDGRNDPDLQNRIFGGIYNVKRLQPGKLLGREEIVDHYSNRVEAVTHDSSTLGGNSGSAIVDILTGDVIGLHFAGIYLKANYAVPTYELARDSFVVDSGVNFAGAVAAHSGDWMPKWKAADPDNEPVAPANQGRGPRGPVVPSCVPAQGGTGQPVTWTVPIHITVSLGETNRRRRTSAAIDSPSVEATTYWIAPDPDYDNRRGYDPHFLGADYRIRFPWLTDAQYQNTARNRWAEEDTHVLPYNHFSVVMNRERRLAYFTAVNIDGTKEVSLSRDTFTDKWFVDPRIQRDEQIENELYVSNPLDRGHLARRLDPTWGGTLDSAYAAHDDTFHWTNCSPQHWNFNRNQSTWAGVENYILDNAKAKDLKVSVFTGPVFRDGDPAYKTQDGTEFQLPLEYWKVVAMIKPDGELSATGYLISQEVQIDDMLEFAYGAFSSFQKTIRKLEELTGLSFDKLRDHDPLAEGGVEATGVTSVRLDTLDKIVI